MSESSENPDIADSIASRSKFVPSGSNYQVIKYDTIWPKTEKFAQDPQC